MRGFVRSLSVSCVFLLALGVAPRSEALPFTYTLSFEYSGLFSGVPQVLLSGSGTSSGGAGGGFTLPAGSITGTADTGPTSLPFINRLQLAASSGPGSVARPGPGAPLVGTMSLGGSITQFISSLDPSSALSIPLAVVGVGGSQPYSGVVNGTTVSGTITGSPWTLGTVTLTDQFGYLSFGGFDARAPDGTGSMRLVTGFDVTYDCCGVDHVIGLAALTLNFVVPEPATALLLGSGIAGLVLFGRTKRD